MAARSVVAAAQASGRRARLLASVRDPQGVMYSVSGEQAEEQRLAAAVAATASRAVAAAPVRYVPARLSAGCS
ncbi:MAG TPA: hypothetical protein VGO31_01015 [Microbacteriaceae bacterium]|nr:hypothetical protein [Microbacteriaceae bacterium]